MSKTIPVIPTKAPIRNGVAVTFYVDKEIKEAIKIIGGGKISRGINQIFKTYEKEILKAANLGQKKSA